MNRRQFVKLAGAVIAAPMLAAKAAFGRKPRPEEGSTIHNTDGCYRLVEIDYDSSNCIPETFSCWEPIGRLG